MRGNAYPEVTSEDSSGEMHVLLDLAGGDHIVTKFTTSKRGEQFDITLPQDTPAWERAVERAGRAVTFVENGRRA